MVGAFSILQKNFLPWRLLFRRRQTRLNGFEALVHLLDQVFELVHASVVTFGGFGAGVFVVSVVGTGAAVGATFTGMLETLDLRFDDGRDFDAEVVTLEKCLESGNRTGVSTRSQSANSGETNGVMLLGQIRGDLFGDFLVVFLQASETADGGHARIERLAVCRPVEKRGDGFVVGERSEGA